MGLFLTEHLENPDNLKLFPFKGGTAQKTVRHMSEMSVSWWIAAVLTREFKHTKAFEVSLYVAAKPEELCAASYTVDTPNTTRALCLNVRRWDKCARCLCM